MNNISNCADHQAVTRHIRTEKIRLNTFELIVPCHFGLEAVMKKEILDLGYEVSQVEDGPCDVYRRCGGDLPRQYFPAEQQSAFCLKVGSFQAETFEELFQGTRATPVGGISPEGREILGREGVLHQE